MGDFAHGDFVNGDHFTFITTTGAGLLKPTGKEQYDRLVGEPGEE